MSRRYDDHEEVATWLRDNIEQVVQYYCPDAKRRGSDLRWDDGRKSVKVTGARRGAFRPFNETDHALDPVGFVQWAIGKLHDPDGRMKAFDEARAVFGVGRAEGERLSEEERQRIREEAERKRAERAEQERKDQEEARAWAHARFTEAQPITGWQPYLNATRGLFLPQWPPCIRFHPECPTKPGGTTAPCILLALQGPWRTSDGQFANNAFMAIQRIYLSDDHAHKRDWKAAKLNYGPSSGALIHLTPLEHVGEDLGICEGLENGLSLQMMVGEKLPVWAATGTSNLSNAALPPQVKRVTIFADWDHEKQRQDGSTFRPGQDAAERLRDKCLAEGRAARIVYPNVGVPGEDWNDWIRRDQGELQRGEITEQEIVEADEEFWTKRVDATPFEQPAEAPETEAADNALQPADDRPPEGHPAAVDIGRPKEWDDLPSGPMGASKPKQGHPGFDWDVKDESLEGPFSDVQQQYAYVAAAEAWFRLSDMQMFSPKGFDRWLYSQPISQPPPDSNRTTRRSATDVLLAQEDTIKLDSVTYWPGKKRFVYDYVQQRTKRCLNLWTPYEVQGEPGDIQPWRDFLMYLFDDDERVAGIFEQWIAMQVQKPGVKINWGPVIIGKPGIGKSTLGSIMWHMLGGPNVGMADQDDLEGDYTKFATNKQLLLFEELDKTSDKAMAKLRIIMTQATLNAKDKYEKAIEVPNRVNSMFFANESRPLRIAPNDRRFMIYRSSADQDPAMTNRLWTWLKGERYTRDDGHEDWTWDGLKALKHHLEHEVDLSDFDPLANAPATGARQELIYASLSDVAKAIIMLMDEDENVLRPDIVFPKDVQEVLANRASIIPPNKVTPGSVYQAFRELQWEVVKTDAVVRLPNENKTRKVTMWARQNAQKWRNMSPQVCYDHYVQFKADANARETERRWGMNQEDMAF